MFRHSAPVGKAAASSRSAAAGRLATSCHSAPPEQSAPFQHTSSPRRLPPPNSIPPQQRSPSGKSTVSYGSTDSIGIRTNRPLNKIHEPIHRFNTDPVMRIMDELLEKIARPEDERMQARLFSAKQQMLDVIKLEMQRINDNQAFVDRIKDTRIDSLKIVAKASPTLTETVNKTLLRDEEEKDKLEMFSFVTNKTKLEEKNLRWHYAPIHVPAFDAGDGKPTNTRYAGSGTSADDPVVIPDSTPKPSPASSIGGPPDADPFERRFLKRAFEEEIGDYVGPAGKRICTPEEAVSPTLTLGESALPMQTWTIGGPLLWVGEGAKRPHPRGRMEFLPERKEVRSISYSPITPPPQPANRYNRNPTPYYAPPHLVRQASTPEPELPEYEYHASESGRQPQMPERQSPPVDPELLEQRLATPPYQHPVPPLGIRKYLAGNASIDNFKKQSQRQRGLRRKRRAPSPFQILEDDTAGTSGAITDEMLVEREVREVAKAMIGEDLGFDLYRGEEAELDNLADLAGEPDIEPDFNEADAFFASLL
ncbi:MAG: hypothetical protein MMC33_009630 [Icmadophila ericetorum]|nr:hypothetical protein [Icmadophila ericetorum]